MSFIHLVLYLILYILVKIDDGQERNAVEIQIASTTSVSCLVQTILLIEKVDCAPSLVQAQSIDGVSVQVGETVGDLLQRSIGTEETNPLLLQYPEEEGMELV